MNLFSHFLILSLFFCASSFDASVSEAAECSPKFEVTSFVERWNGATNKWKAGNWVLPVYVGAGPIVQRLDDTSLLLRANVKKGCIVDLKIRSRASEGDGLAALLAWLTVVKVMSPGIETDDKQKLLSNLGIKPPTRDGGTFVYEEVSYSFQDDITTNQLSVTFAQANPSIERE